MTDKNITFDVLYDKVSKYIDNQEELYNIKKSYEYAAKIHKNKKRKTGDDYITHPLAVAYILSDLNVDSTTIIAALLHETINHGTATKKEIEELFGEDVAKIVDCISKINKMSLQDDKESSAAYLRKILVGMSEDVRVLFVKLADRLHNMRTIWALNKKEQKAKAKETMSVLIPIAHRLGINSIKSELEDLSLRYTDPQAYQDIVNHLDATHEELNELLSEMKDSISDILTEHNINFQIKGRVKSVHSIYQKLSKGKTWNNIYDILALRVFVEKVSDCYLAIGLIHSKFRPMPKRFKDYIAMPKENMYQSLHTTVFGIDGHLFEVQVRTYEMDEIAEKGIASHWSYKEKGKGKFQNILEQKLEMFRNLIDASKDESDQEFVSTMDNELLQDSIYCFTPKGDVVELPKHSTPIDFAYRIHSKVGDTMVGAIVNDSIVPLDHELQDDDIVKIMTNPQSKPSKEWLNIVKTPQAKNKIKAYFSKQEKENYILKGQSLLEKEIRKRKKSISEVLTEENINKVKKDLHLNDLDDIYLSIGSLRHTPNYIYDLIYQDKKDLKDLLLNKIGESKPLNEDYKSDIIVSGTDDIKVNLAKCCNPVYGDEITGYITKGEGITIHRVNCSNTKDKENRLINVSWGKNNDKLYITTIIIDLIPGKDNLSNIIALITSKNIHIDGIKSKEINNSPRYEMTLKVKNKEELDQIIINLSNQKYIKNVERKLN